MSQLWNKGLVVHKFLIRSLFAFLIIFTYLIRAEELSQHIHIDFNLSQNQNLTTLQKLYAHAILSQTAQERDLPYMITPNRDKGLVFEGTEEEYAYFQGDFLRRLTWGLSPEEFNNGKEGFLHHLELSHCFFEKTLASGITWEDICQNSLEIGELVTYLGSNEMGRMQPLKDLSLDVQLYYDLRLTQEDRENIDQLIQKLADRNVLELLIKKKKMKRLGDKIMPVHPLRFMGYICSSPDLRSSLSKIYDSHFKWKNFISGFGNRMSLESSRGNLYPYLQGFAHCTGLSLQRLEIYVRQKDWDGMVISMIN